MEVATFADSIAGDGMMISEAGLRDRERGDCVGVSVKTEIDIGFDDVEFDAGVDIGSAACMEGGVKTVGRGDSASSTC